MANGCSSTASKVVSWAVFVLLLSSFLREPGPLQSGEVQGDRNHLSVCYSRFGRVHGGGPLPKSVRNFLSPLSPLQQSLQENSVCRNLLGNVRQHGLLITAGLGGDKSLYLMFPVLPCKYQGVSPLCTSKYLYVGIKKGET